MHGWVTGTQPAGGRLKGPEFKRVRDLLAGTINPPHSTESTNAASKPSVKPVETVRNIPLSKSENEKARELATLDDKFIRAVASMPPSAASYVRRHSCLSLALMQKWRVGVLPQDGGGDKRGWSLRGQLLYPVFSEDGQLLAWVARDPRYEEKEHAFDLLPPEQRAKEKKPTKHRFPVDFHRGIELFGQHAARLDEPGYREIIAECGVIIVEGFNDVLGLDALGIPAIGIMSNKITAGQIEKVERWAKLLASGKVTILFDADDAGDEGAKEAAWQLLQRGLDVRLGWSQEMHAGAFKGRQPEGIKQDEWQQILVPSITRRAAAVD
jgi:5S rRNA maturation endonuclease (ribonuclease M5)